MSEQETNHLPEVLIIDDDKILSSMVRMALKESHLRVRVANNFEDGKIALRQRSYALILLDLHLNNDHLGLELLRLPHHYADRVVLLSAFIDDEITEEALNLGVCDVIRKPIQLTLLAHKVHTLIGIIDQLNAKRDHFTPSQLEAVHITGIAEPRSKKKISVERMRIKPAHFFCRSCQSLTLKQDKSCGNCKAFKPVNGWPKTVGETLKLLGWRIGRFKFEQILGTGAVGTVFRATDTVIAQQVAIKLITIEDNDSEAIKQIKHEARTLALIQSPHVGKIRDVLEHENFVAIIMDLVRGENIKDWIQTQQAAPPLILAQVMKQTAEGLHAAHQKGIVHRDVKPDNIHIEIRANNRVHTTVIDFGIAHKFGEATKEVELFFGTPAFAAPEQIRAQKLFDHRVDIYALGCVFYFMATTKLPFKAKKGMAMLRHHLRTPHPFFTKQTPHLNDSLLTCYNWILSKMMAKDPNNRFQSMDEVIDVFSSLEHRAMTQKMNKKHKLEFPNTSQTDIQQKLYKQLLELKKEKEKLKKSYTTFQQAHDAALENNLKRRKIEHFIIMLRADANDLRHELDLIRTFYNSLTKSPIS